mmetsp:Transcript_19940/g.46844  ORF Transcript_19940/g.46844 Transcript_19940/m.46844 type:complete len:562 (+) Transcript_19940:1393-3078(+)
MHRLPLVALAAPAEPLPLPLPLDLGRVLYHFAVAQAGRGRVAGTAVRPRQARLALGALLLLLAGALDGTLGAGADVPVFHLGVLVATSPVLGVVHFDVPPPPSAGGVALPLPSPFEHGRGVDSNLFHAPPDGVGVELGVLVVYVLLPSPYRAGQGRAVPTPRPLPELLLGLDAVPYLVDGRAFRLVEVVVVLPRHGRGVPLLLQFLLLLLEQSELLVDVRIDEVGDVLAVEDLGYRVEPPFGVGEVVLFAVVGGPDSWTAVLPHEVPGGLLRGLRRGNDVAVHGLVIRLDGEGVVLGLRVGIVHGGGVPRPRLLRFRLSGLALQFDALGDVSLPRHAVARLGVHHLETVHDRVDLVRADSAVDPRGQQLFARVVLHGRHPLLCGVAHLEHRRVRPALLYKLLDHRPVLGVERLPLLGVDLVDHHDELLVREERLDGAEERALLLDGVAALLADVHEVQDRAGQVSQRRDGLHLYRVSLLEGVIEYPRRVDDLPPKVLVVRVSHEETLRRERVRLHVDVGPRDLVHERALPHVGQSAHQQRSRVGIQGGEAGHVLPDLLEVR